MYTGVSLKSLNRKTRITIEVRMSEEAKFNSAHSDLPEGTVTFLFTDIEGSTELLKQLKDQYASLLADQRRILREIFSRWNGQEVDMQVMHFSIPSLKQLVL